MRREARLGLAVLAVAVGGGTACSVAGPASQVLGARLQHLEARQHAGHGHARAARGDLRGALRAYQAALAVEPAQPALDLHLGYTYERLSRWSRPSEPQHEEALRRAALCYRSAAEQAPGLRRLALLRLAALHAPGQLNEPLRLESDLQALVELDPAQPDWWLALARLREDAGRGEEAEATLLAARRAVPQAPAVHRELARFYRRHQRPDDFFGALEQRLEQAPDDTGALFTLTEGCFYRAFRDHRGGPQQRRASIARGLAAAGALLRLEPRHAAAQHYRRLLLRLRAEEGA